MFKRINIFFHSTVIKNFLIYFSGSIALKGIALFITPFIMQILTPADYGLLSLTTSFINVLVTFAGLGMRQFLSIEYFHCNVIDRKKLINDILIVYLCIMVPVFLLLSFNVSAINRLVFVNHAWNLLIMISLATAFLQFFVDFFYQIMQYLGASIKLTFIQTSTAFLILILNLIFLYIVNIGVIGILLSQCISFFIIFIIALFAYLKNFYYFHIQLSQSLKRSGWYLVQGLPFIPRMLFAWILAAGDRWILAKYSSMHNVGIYSVADMFGQLFQFTVVLPLSYAYIPPLMEKFTSSKKEDWLNIERWNQKNMWLCMIVVFVLMSLVYFFCKSFIWGIIPEKFYDAITYVWFLLVGYLFLLGSYFASTFLQFQKKIYFLIFALCIPAILNIFLNILLIPYFEISGCVFATVISYVIYFTITLGYNWYVQLKDYHQ